MGVNDDWLIIEPGDAWLKIITIRGTLLDMGLHLLVPVPDENPGGQLVRVLVRGYQSAAGVIEPRAFRLRVEQLPVPGSYAQMGP